MQASPIDLGDAMKRIHFHVTIHVRHRRITRWRLRLGAVVLKLGGWITGVNHTTVEIKR